MFRSIICIGNILLVLIQSSGVVNAHRKHHHGGGGGGGFGAALPYSGLTSRQDNSLFSSTLCSAQQQQSLPLILRPTPTNPSVCPVGYIFHTNVKFCFKIVTRPLSWYDAASVCANDAPGASLLGITNAATQAAVRELLLSDLSRCFFLRGPAPVIGLQAFNVRQFKSGQLATRGPLIVTMSSPRAQPFLPTQGITASTGPLSAFWTGGNDLSVSGQFTFPMQTSSTFTNFVSDERIGDGNADFGMRLRQLFEPNTNCVAIFANMNFEWVSGHCDSPMPYICQAPIISDRTESVSPTSPATLIDTFVMTTTPTQAPTPSTSISISTPAVSSSSNSPCNSRATIRKAITDVLFDRLTGKNDKTPTPPLPVVTENSITIASPAQTSSMSDATVAPQKLFGGNAALLGDKERLASAFNGFMSMLAQSPAASKAAAASSTASRLSAYDETANQTVIQISAPNPRSPPLPLSSLQSMMAMLSNSLMHSSLPKQMASLRQLDVSDDDDQHVSEVGVNFYPTTTSAPMTATTSSIPLMRLGVFWDKELGGNNNSTDDDVNRQWSNLMKQAATLSSFLRPQLKHLDKLLLLNNTPTVDQQHNVTQINANSNHIRNEISLNDLMSGLEQQIAQLARKS